MSSVVYNMIARRNLILLCTTITIVTSNYEEGIPCEINDSSATCLLPENCSVKNAPFCGIRDYVCCEKSNIANRIQDLLRKSSRACNDINDQLGPKLVGQILGGLRADLGEFPHMAALGYLTDDVDDELIYGCAGSLISNQYVLTAAHCCTGRIGKLIQLRLGEVDISDDANETNPEDFEISEIHMHPNYNPRSKHNDIALIKLSREVTIKKSVYPACLYQSDDDPPEMIATGWGSTGSFGSSSKFLLKANLSSVNVESCRSQYLSAKKEILATQLCANSKDGTQDTCSGDSGGPIQILPENFNTHAIVGITSFGKTCDGLSPGVYTRIYSYLDWIEDIVWP